MLHDQEREEIIAYCLRMLEDDLTLGTSGNISVRVDDHVLITPSGVPYDQLTAESICVLDLVGNHLEGDLKPSTEVPFHTLVYARTDARAVIHTHPVHGTVVSTLVDEVPLIHYMLAPLGGPVRVARYARFGTAELAANVGRAMAGRNGVLLQNHGAACWGPDLASAYTRCEYLEWVCKVWVVARSTGLEPRLLSDDEFSDAMAEITGVPFVRDEEVAR